MQAARCKKGWELLLLSTRSLCNARVRVCARTFICERAGVIMYNLVDILIYKQSLMKFLLFINNTLSPLENVSYGAGGLIVRNSHLWK
jgi:hypothetical protein